ncbi:MAG: hypothetical protein MJ239_07410 [Bacilli bacterium]|nr:hypothetical protein [Bacilli bacterium]
MKQEVESLFAQNVALISRQYQRNTEASELIVEVIMMFRLQECLRDAETMNFVEFSKKYINKYEFFEYKDFSVTEIKAIIGETPLTERDRKLAELRYIDLKSEEEIADILYIDKKTVHSNIPKISIALKRTAAKLHLK